MLNALVSIIIPVFHRADLIGATLNSILEQTYRHWECIIVDDGSSDYSLELMDFYCEKDSRIRFFQRPKYRNKGANSCRNYGFEKARGQYIQFFDSDDLMVPHFLQRKLDAFQKTDVDYVISRSINFMDPNLADVIHKNEAYYRFEDFELSNFNYVVQNINWLTPDFISKKDVLKNISFNEKLQSAQERNFFSQLTANNTNARVIHDHLTLRRVHNGSTQSQLRKFESSVKNSYFEFCYETWKDLRQQKSLAATNFLFAEALEYTMDNKVSFKKVMNLSTNFLPAKFTPFFWYLLYQISKRLLNKGYFFRRQFRKAWHRDFQREGFLQKLVKLFSSVESNELINILTRTSGRPNAFRKCRSSILNQTYPNIRHLVSWDNFEDNKYLNVPGDDRVDVSKKKGLSRGQKDVKAYNLYCNDLLSAVVDGWIMFLDDDNVLAHKNVLETIASQLPFYDENTLFIWQTEFPDGNRIPQATVFKRRKIEKRQIDTACFLFHSKYKDAVKWDNKVMADYRFINDLAQIIPKQKWIEMAFTRKLNFGDSGNRNDIDDFNKN